MAKKFAAIDPLALILKGEAYIKLTLPDPPPPGVLRTEIREAVQAMSAAEKRSALAKVETLAVYVSALKTELRR